MGGEDEECGFDYACWWVLSLPLVALSSSPLWTDERGGMIRFWEPGKHCMDMGYFYGWEHGMGWVYHNSDFGIWDWDFGIMMMGWDYI